MSEQPTDSSLQERFIRSDETVLGAMAESWGPKIVKWLHDKDETLDAEDILQDSLLAAYSSRTTFDPTQAGLRTWFNRIVCNTAADEWRRRARERKAINGLLLEMSGCRNRDEGDAVNDVNMKYRTIKDAIKSILKKLPEDQRRAVLWDGSSVELARQLRKKPGTVRVWAMRGRDTIRLELAKLGLLEQEGTDHA